LDVNCNHRTDEWGVDLQGRTKFFKETLNAVLETYPANRVGIKINPCGGELVVTFGVAGRKLNATFSLGAGYNDVGMNEKDTIDTYTEVIKTATDAGLAYIQMTRYLGEL
jgi:2,4-dienoyl-CoA reductase-like NADH-dependent reductase (Old Yellow Enzyme family)